MQKSVDRNGEHFVEDHGGRLVVVEHEVLVVVGTVGRLADARVARLGTDIDSDHRIDVETGKLLSLNDRYSHLRAGHKRAYITPATLLFSTLYCTLVKKVSRTLTYQKIA